MKGKEFIKQMTKLIIDNKLEEADFDLRVRKVVGHEQQIKLSSSQIHNLRSDGIDIIIEIV